MVLFSLRWSQAGRGAPCPALSGLGLGAAEGTGGMVVFSVTASAWKNLDSGWDILHHDPTKDNDNPDMTVSPS